MFRSCCIKPYISRHSTEHVALTAISIDEDEAKNPNKDSDVIPRRRYLSKSSTEEKMSFAKAREEENGGLTKNGTFHVVNISCIGKNIPLFGSKFLDFLKPVDDDYRYKSWLVAQNYSDKQTAIIATKAPTILRFTQRPILTLAGSMD